MNTTEDVFNENSSRWVLFPVQYPQIWEMYKKIMESFWTCEDFGIDKNTLKISTQDSSEQISHASLVAAIGKYATANIIMLGDPSQYHGYPDITELTTSFIEKIQAPEARAFLGFQSAYENIHRETLCQWIVTCDGPLMKYENDSEPLKRNLRYLKNNLGSWYSDTDGGISVGDILIDNTSTDVEMVNDNKENVLEGVNTNISCDQSNDTQQNSDRENLARKLATLVCMKSFQSTGLWIISKLMDESPFKKSAGLIQRDWMLHASFASLIYNSLQNKLSNEEVTNLVRECGTIHTDILESTLGSIPPLKEAIPHAIEAVSRWANVSLGSIPESAENYNREWILNQLVLESRDQPFKKGGNNAGDCNAPAVKETPGCNEGLKLDSDF